jgi:peptide/nickel transport system substrate-binding protein
VIGVPAGAVFELPVLTTDEAEKSQAAEIIRSSLAQCGIAVKIQTVAPEELFASGPDGLVFGRNFSAAQYGWVASLEPPCFLYTSSEIPGPYPEFPKGWGGANASGYSNPEFDQACQQSQATLPDDPEHRQAHDRAQAIFAEDLPALPLYLRVKLVAARPDICNVSVDPSAESALWNLEAFDYGDGCSP